MISIIIAISFAVVWGNIFQGEADFIHSTPSWIAIWAAVNFYSFSIQLVNNIT